MVLPCVNLPEYVEQIPRAIDVLQTMDVMHPDVLLWRHLDGSIGNNPGAGARAIMGRVAADIVRRGKLVDAVLIRDRLCGTTTRPCPKHFGINPPTSLGVAPDIFLFPIGRPTLDNPTPALHDETTIILPFRVLDAYGVPEAEYGNHVWNVHIQVFKTVRGQERHRMEIVHRGRVIDVETL